MSGLSDIFTPSAARNIPMVDALGNKYWFLPNGQRHREDGPAIEYVDGTKKWYIYGESLMEAEFNKWRNDQIQTDISTFNSGIDNPITFPSNRLKLRPPV